MYPQAPPPSWPNSNSNTPAGTNVQSGDVEGVHAFFSDDHGKSLIDPSYKLPDAPDPSLRDRHRNSSGRSAATDVPRIGAIDLSLSDVCEYINDHRSLQRAEIISTECCVENLGRVVHRFLILELRRASRKDVWLRLDRRRSENVSLVRFVALSGVTRANDRALISASKDVIAGQAQAENLQVFKNPPMLCELRILLAIICEEITEYRIWPENCWFFCSLIQQHLEEAQTGRFQNGSLKYPRLAQQVRTKVARRFYMAMAADREAASSKAKLADCEAASSKAKLANCEAAPSKAMLADCEAAASKAKLANCEAAPSKAMLADCGAASSKSKAMTSEPIPEPSTSRVVANVDPRFLAALRTFASKGSFPSGPRRAALEILVHIDQMLTIQSFTHLSGSGPCREVIQRLKRLRGMLRDTRRFAEAVVLMRGAVALQKDLCAQDPSESESSLTELIQGLSDDLYESKCFADSCAMDEEVILILRRLCMDDLGRHRVHLAVAMMGYGVHLFAMQRWESACAADKTCVKIFRELHELNPRLYSNPLAYALRSYGSHLHILNEYVEERDALEESVLLHREWLKTDAATHIPGLATSLHQYALALHNLRLFQQACIVSKECIVLRAQLYEQDPAKYRRDLMSSMEDQAKYLRSVGRTKEASAICEDIDFLKSSSSDSDE